MATVALVPLRSPGEGKRRLATALTREERAALAGAMLADVARALAGAAVDRVVVAASGAPAAAAASALGLDVLLDPPTVTSLDGALSAATTRVGPVDTLVVVAADLPTLAAGDVDALLAVDADVVVAPTDDGGTGGLVRRPGDVLAPAYGGASAARHLHRARRQGLRAAAVELAGFALDVDTWDDVTRLPNRPAGPATATFLRSIAPRLHAAG